MTRAGNLDSDDASTATGVGGDGDKSERFRVRGAGRSRLPVFVGVLSEKGAPGAVDRNNKERRAHTTRGSRPKGGSPSALAMFPGLVGRRKKGGRRRGCVVLKVEEMGGNAREVPDTSGRE